MTLRCLLNPWRFNLDIVAKNTFIFFFFWFF
ncbi:putative membrane protein, partial [Escherichia coli FRIK1990]